MYILAIYGVYGDLLEKRKGDNLDALQRLGEEILDRGLHGWIPVMKVAIFRATRCRDVCCIPPVIVRHVPAVMRTQRFRGGAGKKRVEEGERGGA